MSSVRYPLISFFKTIRLSHTVFALPFALSSVILAQRNHPVSIGSIIWILVAMVGARSASMGINRIADAEIDAINPRTANREIPSGKLTIKAAIGFVAVFSMLFIFASYMLGKLCFYLSFPVLLTLFLYSWTKRFTWLAHLYLGFAISLAPIGAWIAISQSFSSKILLLSGALMTYIAGFDILYACQDAEFDSRYGLYSIPSRFGIRRAMSIAALLHIVSLIFFLLIYPAFEMSLAYPAAVVLIGLFFYIEHRLVNPDDLSRINIAFFHMNSCISIMVFMGVLADEIVRKW